jgi:hypothetical protein
MIDNSDIIFWTISNIKDSYKAIHLMSFPVDDDDIENMIFL